MRIKEKLMQKKKYKATQEVNVVIDCQARNKCKLDALRARIREEEARDALLIEKGRGVDGEEQKRIAKEIMMIRKSLKILKEDESGYQAIDELFGQLIPLLKSFHDKERFQYIIKMIPEKDLPQMINDPKRIGEVYLLLENIFKQFHEEAERLLRILKAHHENERLEERAHDNFRANNEVEDEYTHDILEEMNSGKKDASEKDEVSRRRRI